MGEAQADLLSPPDLAEVGPNHVQNPADLVQLCDSQQTEFLSLAAVTFPQTNMEPQHNMSLKQTTGPLLAFCFLGYMGFPVTVLLGQGMPAGSIPTARIVELICTDCI